MRFNYKVLDYQGRHFKRRNFKLSWKVSERAIKMVKLGAHLQRRKAKYDAMLYQADIDNYIVVQHLAGFCERVFFVYLPNGTHRNDIAFVAEQRRKIWDGTISLIKDTSGYPRYIIVSYKLGILGYIERNKGYKSWVYFCSKNVCGQSVSGQASEWQDAVLKVMRVYSD